MSSKFLTAFTLLLVCSAWILSWNGRDYGPPYVSDDGDLYFDHDRLILAHSKEDIVDAVKQARAVGYRLRVLGSGHSWSPVATSNDTILSLYYYRGLVSHDKARKRVTVRGGTTLAELNSLLDGLGLAMTNLPSISHQTVAGTIATGTHGTGLQFGNLATLVTDFELVTGTGEVIRVSDKDTNSNVFHAGVISLGLLGVVTEVTLQCEDAFNLLEDLQIMEVDRCLHEMPSAIERSEHVKYWIEYFSNTCAVFAVNRTAERPRNNPHQLTRDLPMYMFGFMQWLMAVFPAFTPYGMRAVVGSGLAFPPHVRVDRSHRVFNIPHKVLGHPETEIAVGVKHCVDSVRILHNMIKEDNLPVNFIAEVRFVKADNIWLSPNYGRDSCHITQLLYSPTDQLAHSYFSTYHHHMERYDGRPHWGKLFNTTPAQLHHLYPRMKDFLELRKELDPDRLFVNPFLAEQLGR